MYLVSVYFDAQATRILKRYIDLVAKQTHNDFMVVHQVPPHMTIAAIEARSVEVLKAPFLSLQENVCQGTIRFVTVGQLLPYVFYAAPVPGDYLANLSKQVYEAYRDVPETSLSRFYQPDSWLPHVTLGKTLDRQQMIEALQVMQMHFQPFTAKVVRMGLAKVNPHEDVAEFEMKLSV